MRSRLVHVRTPGQEDKPVCNHFESEPKLTWFLGQVTCSRCKKRVEQYPQLRNAIMEARQQHLPGVT